MTDLTSMMNIGREMARKLTAVGVDSAEKLREDRVQAGVFPAENPLSQRLPGTPVRSGRGHPAQVLRRPLRSDQAGPESVQ